MIFVSLSVLITVISLSPYSTARVPIGRGVRARKYKAHYSTASTINTPNITNNALNTIIGSSTRISSNVQHKHQSSSLLSDEENTSEYSHPPSSEHSTLESNSGVPKNVHSMAQPTDNTRYAVSSSSSSSSASSSDSEDSEANTKPGHTGTKTRSSSGRQQSSRRQQTTRPTAVDSSKLNNNNRTSLVVIETQTFA